ncbi:MAG: DUF4112 domain-containing protein [Proteobacteria bacterium]|nr:DUF4112 domain-containing protein [Pseudomonadota bacterium]
MIIGRYMLTRKKDKAPAREKSSNVDRQRPGLFETRQYLKAFRKAPAQSNMSFLQKISEGGLPPDPWALGSENAKPNISQPNDTAEREATQVAQQIMSIPEPAKLNDTHLSSNYRKIYPQSTSKPIKHSVSGHGQSLDTTTLEYFGERFGHQFNPVRLHTDSLAVETAKLFDAKAFTIGNNIVFNSGQLSPNSSVGKQLLAHELTHVVQQDHSVHHPFINRASGTQKKKCIMRTAAGRVIGQHSGLLGLDERGLGYDLRARIQRDNYSNSSIQLAFNVFVELSGDDRNQIAFYLINNSITEFRRSVATSGDLGRRLLRWVRDLLREGSRIVYLTEGDYNYHARLVSEALTWAESREEQPATPIAPPLVSNVPSDPAPIEVQAEPNARVLPEVPETQLERAHQVVRPPRHIEEPYVPSPIADPEEYLAPRPPIIDVEEEDEESHIRSVPLIEESFRAEIGHNRSILSYGARRIELAVNRQQVTIAQPFVYQFLPPVHGRSYPIIRLVISPGVRATLQGFPSSYILDENTPGVEIYRVQNPDLVPHQGETIHPSQFVGLDEIGSMDSFPPNNTTVRRRPDGADITHQPTDICIAITAPPRLMGVRFAYEVIPPNFTEHRYWTQITVVATPPTTIRIRGTQLGEYRTDPQIRLYEAPLLTNVPAQGESLSQPRSIWRPWPIRREDVDPEPLSQIAATSGMDMLIGMIPIVGDLVDIAELTYGLFTGQDRWGRPLTALDLALIGIGVLIPFVGASVIRGGATAVRRAGELAELAENVGRNSDEVAELIQRAGRLTDSEQGQVAQWIAGIRRGQDIPESELSEAQRILGRVDEAMSNPGGAGGSTHRGGGDPPATPRASSFIEEEAIELARRHDLGDDAGTLRRVRHARDQVEWEDLCFDYEVSPNRSWFARGDTILLRPDAQLPTFVHEIIHAICRSHNPHAELELGSFLFEGITEAIARSRVGAHGTDFAVNVRRGYEPHVSFAERLSSRIGTGPLERAILLGESGRLRALIMDAFGREYREIARNFLDRMQRLSRDNPDLDEVDSLRGIIVGYMQRNPESGSPEWNRLSLFELIE